MTAQPGAFVAHPPIAAPEDESPSDLPMVAARKRSQGASGAARPLPPAVRFASVAHRARTVRDAERARAIVLFVPKTEPGQLGAAIDADMEAVLASRGALPPSLCEGASARAVTLDQVNRAAALPVRGICICLPRLLPLADDQGVLGDEDAQALQRWMDAANAERRLRLVVLFDEEDRGLSMRVPTPLEQLLGRHASDHTPVPAMTTDKRPESAYAVPDLAVEPRQEAEPPVEAAASAPLPPVEEKVVAPVVPAIAETLRPPPPPAFTQAESQELVAPDLELVFPVEPRADQDVDAAPERSAQQELEDEAAAEAGVQRARAEQARRERDHARAAAQIQAREKEAAQRAAAREAALAKEREAEAEREREEAERAGRLVAMATWRQFAMELDGARGPKPPSMIEKLFVQRYVPLLGAIAREETDGAVENVVQEWRSSFAESYEASFGSMRVTTKRPPMVMDAPEVALRVARLASARSVKLVLVDSMSFDLAERVAARVGVALDKRAVLVDRSVLWSALPATTPTQMHLLARGVEGLKDIPPPVSEPEVQRGRTIASVRRERLGAREVLKLDLVEARLRSGGPSYDERLDAIAIEVADALVRVFETFPARTLAYVFGDHGFRLSPGSNGWATGPSTQGGATPEEVLVAGHAWLLDAVQ